MVDVHKKVFIVDGLDPHVIELEPQDTPMEELENYQVDSQDPTKLLQVGKGLLPEAKEKLKGFLYRNLSVFIWGHEDMVGIESRVNFYSLKIDPMIIPHR